MPEQSVLAQQLESHLLRGLSPALNPTGSVQTFCALQPTRASTNCKADLLPRWLVLLPALHGSLGAIDARTRAGH